MGVGAGLYMYNVVVNKVLYGTCQNLFRDPSSRCAHHSSEIRNIGSTLCSTLQSLADAHYWSAVQQRCQHAKPIKICRGAPNYRTDLSRQWADGQDIVGTSGREIAA